MWMNVVSTHYSIEWTSGIETASHAGHCIVMSGKLKLKSISGARNVCSSKCSAISWILSPKVHLKL